MDQPGKPLLNRRRFIAYGATLAAGLLAACSSNGDSDTEQDSETPEFTPTETEPSPEPTATTRPATPTPSPTSPPERSPTPTPDVLDETRFWITPELDGRAVALIESVRDAIRERVENEGGALVTVDRQDKADIALSLPKEESEARRVYGEALIPVTAPEQPVVDITMDELSALLSGEIDNWMNLGGRDHPVSRALHASASGTGVDAETVFGYVDELNQMVSEEPGLIALIPRSMATIRALSLRVDDVDPLRDVLDRDNWPYWEQFDLRVSENVPDSLRQAIDDALDEIGQANGQGNRTTISVVGDVMLGRTVHTIMTRQNDWNAPYTLVRDELRRSDLTIGNLECAITGSYSPPEDPRTFSFMTFPDAASGLADAGFNALSGANNHALDFGVVGMQDTTEALRSAGIEHFGAGDNLTEARRPCILTHEDTTFAILGYDSISMGYAGATAESGGVAPMVREYVAEDIQRAREEADVVIPFFHWGVEYTLTPTDESRAMAHAAIDAGADLVLGGHPHWVQGMEIYDGKPIFYSLANFVFDQEWSVETKQGFVLQLVFAGSEIVGFRIVPILIEDFYRPRIVEDEMRRTISDRFWESTSLIAGAPVQ